MTKATKGRIRKAALIGGVGFVALIAMAACGHMMMMSGVEKPAASEFGFGPRQSPTGLYAATLDPMQEIRVRRMQTMRVVITDQDGEAIENADILIDGGMPQHGHGLPTQPRVTRYLGDGAYEVEGVKFNMGGWWEFKLAINTEAGEDTVTFNLEL